MQVGHNSTWALYAVAEISHPSEAIQSRRWEKHFKWNSFRKDALKDLIAQCPTHLRAIDVMAGPVKIKETPPGDDGLMSRSRLNEMIGRFRKRKEKPGFLWDRN